MSFADALDLQERIARAHASLGDTLLLLEHDPVYTTGRGGREENLPRPAAGAASPPVFRIGRGGDATYHGPGQVVGYALVDLRARDGDVHRFLRALEAGVIAVLGAFGVAAGRWPGRTGVWVFGPRGAGSGAPHAPGSGPIASPGQRHGARKIASIGIGVRRGITMHGFALNVAVDLQAFAAIVPCAIAGVEMTSMAAEGIDPVPSVEQVATTAAGVLRPALAWPPSADCRRDEPR